MNRLLRSCAVVWLMMMTSTTMVGSAPVLNIFTVATGFQEGNKGIATSTSATLITQFTPGFAFANYTLNVFNGVKITQAHLHCAAAGETGQVVAFLFTLRPAGVNLRSGKLVSGRLQNANIVNNTDFKKAAGCGVTINNIASLYNAVKEGLIYVNVHTVAHPDGEVRGQLYV